MSLRAAIALLLLVVGPAANAATPASGTVRVARDRDEWTADYLLTSDSPVWLFAKSVIPRESHRSWREGTVRVLTPGVSLQRLGHYDALVAARGNVPRHVRLSFTPFFKDIEAGYDAAIALGNDSVALYADGFRLVPSASLVAARSAPKDDSLIPAADAPMRLVFRDKAGPVLAQGKRVAEAAFDDGAAYVIFGKAEPAIGPAVTTIIHPETPTWIADYLKRGIPQIIASFKRSLGPAPVEQPTLLVSWLGATKGVTSLGGSVLPGMVLLVMEGEGITAPNPAISNYARWFAAHESAHFWLGQAVAYSSPSESWITEGGADLLAFRATAAADAAFDVAKRLSEARAECEPFLKEGGVAGAFEREGHHRAFYACGALIALAAEKASNGNFGDFVRALIGRHREKGIVTRGDWLALLEEMAPGRGYGAAVADLLDNKQADPTAAIDHYIAAVGIADQFVSKSVT